MWLEQLSRGRSEALVESQVCGCFAIPAGLVLNSSHHRLVRSFVYSYVGYFVLPKEVGHWSWLVLLLDFPG